MMFKTHLAFGFFAGLVAMPFLHPHNQILFMTLVLLAAMLPDIDHPKSKLGKYFKPIGYLFEHRGFFHSLFFVVITLLLTKIIFKDIIFVYAVVIGHLSHLIADALTKEGIMPFHPWSRTRVNGFIKTGTFAEYIIFIILVVYDAIRLLRF